MKRMQKITSVLLALVMALAMMVPAFAETTYPQNQPKDEKYTITIQDAKEGNAYGAYQIFQGELSYNSDPETAENWDATGKTLSNITWGQAIDETKVVSALSVLEWEDFTAYGDAAAVADYLSKHNNVETAKAFAEAVEGALKTTPDGSLAAPQYTSDDYTNGTYTISGVVAGYYMVMNTKTGDNQASTSFILEVVGDATAKPKNTSTPEPDKQVQDKNDSTGETSDWQYSADHDIGDKVDYKLTAILPESLDGYKGYALNFVDTMSKGLTLDEDSIVVYVKGSVKSKDNPTVVDETAYEVEVIPNEADGSTTLKVKFANVKLAPLSAEAGNVITVEYTAILNDDAVIGATGNKNTMHLEFSNDPNHSGDGTPDNPPPHPKVLLLTKSFSCLLLKVI